MEQMRWLELLSAIRLGSKKSSTELARSPFHKDYDRIIFSQSFRQLNRKTQVHPLTQHDGIHTRLTHSLEVSCIGRSLGMLAAEKIKDELPMWISPADVGAIIQAACLAHDIGNPPFGHSGEKAIGEYFKSGNGQQYKNQLAEKEWQDLIDFEGNANGFSVLTGNRPGNEGGLRISYATLGAFMKYPKESLPKKPTTAIADKKYGFFQQDKAFFKEVAEELGLISNKTGDNIGYERHPLAYLVEAADDICYTIIDFEDGINLGWISEEYALEYLIKLVKNGIDSKKYNELLTKEDRISYLRALAIGSLINDAVAVFMENEQAILAGEFPFALMDKSQYKAQMNDIIQISIKNVYQSKEVIQKEVMGYKIINSLLDSFCTAYNKKVNGTASNYDELLLKLLPERFQFQKDSLYDRLLHICHFVSLLTDGKALELYKTIQVNK